MLELNPLCPKDPQFMEYVWLLNETQKHILECKILNQNEKQILEYEKIENGNIIDMIQIARKFNPLWPGVSDPGNIPGGRGPKDPQLLLGFSGLFFYAP